MTNFYQLDLEAQKQFLIDSETSRRGLKHSRTIERLIRLATTTF